MDSEYRKADLKGKINRAGAFVHSGCGVGENVGVLHSVGVLRHRHHAPALWLRSEV